jgi:hypothetical protein
MVGLNIQCSEIFTLRYEKLHTESGIGTERGMGPSAIISI